MNTKQEHTLLPCPFCGEAAYFERHGTHRQSCIVACQSCGCSLETGETGHDCGGMWNTRAAQQSQDREDAERLDWLERHDGSFYKLGRIACVVGARFRGTEQDVWHPSLREAIDYARRIEGEGE